MALQPIAPPDWFNEGSCSPFAQGNSYSRLEDDPAESSRTLAPCRERSIICQDWQASKTGHPGVWSADGTWIVSPVPLSNATPVRTLRRREIRAPATFHNCRLLLGVNNWTVHESLANAA
jgi:hypothetical protein